MKYIITTHGSPILFSEAIGHDEMARKFRGATSAGFVSITAEGIGNGETVQAELQVHCYGRSVSLGIGRSPKDRTAIENMLLGY